MNSKLCRAALSLLLSLVLSCIVASAAAAQGASAVAPSDLASRDLDRLAELGVLDSAIIGQRPYSRRAILRMVRAVEGRSVGDATRGVDPRAAAEARRLVARVRARLFTEPGDAEERQHGVFRVVDDASLALVSSDARRRALVGFGAATEATINPLAERRLGQPAPRGQSAALELSQRIEPTDWLAIQARERVQASHASDGEAPSSDGELLLGTVRARFRNAAVTVGRQQVAWSQRPAAGLFLAADAPALDQLSLASDEPFVLPGLLRHLGPTQATLLVANLGASRERSHSRLVAYKVSVAPTNALELGGTFMDHFGGEGAPTASAVDRLIDVLPFVDVFRRHNYSDTTRTLDVESDKLLGIDGRLRLARLAGIVLTGEILVDDVDIHRIRTMFTWDGSQTFGLLFPSLGTPAVGLQLSAAHMGIRTYTHGQLPNGITTRGRLLGSELGPDAKEYSAAFRWTAGPALDLTLAGTSAIYSKADYAPRDVSGVLQIGKSRTYPNELRDRVIAGAVVHRGAALAITARAGGERTRNFAFQGVRARAYVAELTVQLVP